MWRISDHQLNVRTNITWITLKSFPNQSSQWGVEYKNGGTKFKMSEDVMSSRIMTQNTEYDWHFLLTLHHLSHLPLHLTALTSHISPPSVLQPSPISSSSSFAVSFAFPRPPYPSSSLLPSSHPPHLPSLPSSLHSSHLTSVCSRRTSEPLNCQSDTKACSLGHIMWLSHSVLVNRSGNVRATVYLSGSHHRELFSLFKSHGRIDEGSIELFYSEE